VPYKGGVQAVADLLAGHVDMYFGNASEMLPHLTSGRAPSKCNIFQHVSCNSGRHTATVRHREFVSPRQCGQCPTTGYAWQS
jgi:hypothetical protein